MSSRASSNETRRYGVQLNPLVNKLKRNLALTDKKLAAQYWKRANVDDLILERTKYMDKAIEKIWQQAIPSEIEKQLTLLAVGGYGRKELFPHSDIDLLIICKNPESHNDAISRFLHGLYDLNVEIGHAVRTIKECKQEMKTDITVATAMFERRFLAGSKSIAFALDKMLKSPRLWPSKKFYKAKYEEQHNRHRQFDNVEYGLEPNIKSSPGGLRDLQTVFWVLDREFGTTDINALEELGILNPEESTRLDEGRRYLWWIRYGIHLISGRKEDRLLFEYQRELSQKLGFADTKARLGVERFMQLYYQHILELREANDILLQHFEEAILRFSEKPKLEVIDKNFQIRNGYIEARSPLLFENQPSALLELFVVMANRRDISGVRANTIRLIRENVDLIDERFRNDPKNNKLFIDLLKAPYTLVSQLTRMRRYGVLGKYLPAFGEVIGQMQHDLFHIYTVDAHTMMVIRNMRRFHYRASEEKFPVACHCVKSLPKIEILYIAGLFHDIGKGRGGDHSSLGAEDAKHFCMQHKLNADDTSLVVWLVENHLLMSSVAQRKDLYDPEIIYDFASIVKSEMRLNYLYALTVADINATNPTLWNSWKASLLRQLFSETRKALRRGLESPIDRQAAANACKDRAKEKLLDQAIKEEDIEIAWSIPNDDFFLRHTPRQVSELTLDLIKANMPSPLMVSFLDLQGQVSEEGATEIVLFTHDRPNLFVNIVVELSRLGLAVYEANIHTSETGLCLNTFVVLNSEGRPIGRDKELRNKIKDEIKMALEQKSGVRAAPTRRLTRQLRELSRSTKTELTNDGKSDYSTLTIIASDRPGILSTIGTLFSELRINVLSAKITTLGDQVEDLFYISNEAGEAISDKQIIYLLENTLRQRIDQLVNI